LEIELTGEAESLEILTRLPLPPQIVLEKTEEGATLREMVEEVRQELSIQSLAIPRLDWLNALGALVDSAYLPVRAAAVRCGVRSTLASFGATVFIRDPGFVEANAPSPPTMSPAMAAVGLRDPTARDVLHFYAIVPRDEFILYKILEAISEDLGGKKDGKRALVDKRWLTETGLASLDESLNNRIFAGDRARHFRSWNPKEKARSMALPDVEECVRRLLLHWLDWKA
jgi:hypothetical protein